MTCVRTVRPNPTMDPSTPGGRHELTVEDVAARSGKPERTTRHQVAGWFAKQLAEPSLPRVRKATVTGTQRWAYLIDARSYDAWLLSQSDPTEIPPFATEAARALGCTCERFEHAGEWRAMVAESCPVHGQWLQTG